MKKFEQLKQDLLKEKESIESNIIYYREMRDVTTDSSTREMYNSSLEYARGRWYGIITALKMIERYK